MPDQPQQGSGSNYSVNRAPHLIYSEAGVQLACSVAVFCGGLSCLVMVYCGSCCLFTCHTPVTCNRWPGKAAARSRPRLPASIVSLN